VDSLQKKFAVELICPVLFRRTVFFVDARDPREASELAKREFGYTPTAVTEVVDG